MAASPAEDLEARLFEALGDEAHRREVMENALDQTYIGSLCQCIPPMEVQVIASQALHCHDEDDLPDLIDVVLILHLWVVQQPTQRKRRRLSVVAEILRIVEHHPTDLWSRIRVVCDPLVVSSESDLLEQAAYRATLVRVAGEILEAGMEPELDEELVECILWFPWRRYDKAGLSDMERAVLLHALDHEDDPRSSIFESTVWDETKVAKLALFIVRARGDQWSPMQTWKCIVPHLGPLMMSDLDESFTESFTLLQQALGRMETRSVALNALDAPSSPLGLFQLLSNHVLNVSRSPKLLPPQSPSASKTFDLMSKLLSVCHERDQVKLVSILMQTCPHAGLKPRYLDLLRACVSYKDQKAIDDVWELLERNLAKLDDCLDESTFVEHAIDSIEESVSTIGLIRRWALLVKTEPPLMTIVRRIDSKLSRILGSTLDAEITPDLGSNSLYVLHLATSQCCEAASRLE